MDVKKTVFLLFVAMSGSLCFWLLDILGLVKCSFTVYKVETLTIRLILVFESIFKTTGTMFTTIPQKMDIKFVHSTYSLLAPPLQVAHHF